MKVELIGRRLLIGEFIYVKSSTDEHRKVSWDCIRYRKSNCRAKAITSDPALSEKILLYKGLNESKHNHEPSPEEIREAENLAKSGSRGLRHRLQTNNQRPSASSANNARTSREYSSRVEQNEAAARSELDQSNNLKMKILSGKRALEASSSETPPKRRNRCFLTHPDTYHQFLMAFVSEGSIFDRYHIMKALNGIYKSDYGRLSAYALVLENRENIMRDLETLRKGSDSMIKALERINTNSLRTNDGTTTGVQAAKTNQTTSMSCTSRTEPLMRNAQTRENPLPRGQIIETIPPVPAAIPIKDLLPVERNPSHTDEIRIEIKREIPLVDLTDDPVVKQENTGANEDTTQSIQNGSTNTQKSSLIEPHLYQNQLAALFNSQKIPNDSIQQPVSIITANPNFPVPTLIPIIINIPCIKKDGTSEMKQVFSHMIQINSPINQQPVASQQSQGSKN